MNDWRLGWLDIEEPAPPEGGVERVAEDLRLAIEGRGYAELDVVGAALYLIAECLGKGSRNYETLLAEIDTIRARLPLMVGAASGLYNSDLATP